MTGSSLLKLISAPLLVLMLAPPVWAKTSQPKTGTGSQTRLISQLGMQRRAGLVRFSDINPIRAIDPEISRRRLPLGASVTLGNGVGEIIDNTYNDLQRYVNQGRNVEHGYDTVNGYVDVHFVYEEYTDIDGHNNPEVFADPSKTGYNVWDANDSTWPWGQEAGCLIQTGDSVEASDSHLEVMPNGLVVICARDNYNARSQAAGWRSMYGYIGRDNHFYWQESRHSCYFDTGGAGSNSNMIEPADYQPGMLGDTSAQTDNPIVAVQVIGSDTITHVAVQEYPYHTWAGGAPSYTYRVIKYFRKLGSGFEGNWQEPQVIDTVHTLAYPCLAASRWSGKVSLAWVSTSPSGVTQDSRWDQDCFYRESVNGGIDWNQVQNITNYRRDTISATCMVEVNTLYDSQDRLHLIWAAVPTSMNPYRDDYFWGDFSVNLYHWCDAIGTISKVADANYGSEAQSIICGFGMPGGGYILAYSVSECDGNLYCVYDQIHHRINELGLEAGSDDCSTDLQTLASANWEMFLTVSSSLDGLLWDAPRNLSNTYTPGCDSASGTGGPCGSEYKPSVEKYGLNEMGLDLKWPANARIDPDTIAFGIDSAYQGDFFLNVMYLDDEYPGSWYLPDPRRNDVPRFNALKWLRVACVNPISAPQIAADPEYVSWTDDLSWIKNGELRDIVVTVTNDGNQTLDVYYIGTDESSGSDWLSVSAGTLSVPAGVPNTATFTVTVDAGALAYGLGTASWLDGVVYLKSDAGNTDSLGIDLHILAADSVQPVAWDTAATSTAWDPIKTAAGAGDNTALAVSNFGEVGANGMNGNMQANLDFSKDGEECRTDDRAKLYAWSGSPYVIQHDGGGANLRLSTSFNQQDQALEHSFDPLVASQSLTGGVSTGGEYDSVYTGPFANRDTSVVMARTLYAPRDNPNNPSFLVCKTVVYSGDGQAQDNVTIGSFTDWDVPSVESPDNTVGTSAPSSPAGQYVYCRGTDVDTVDANLLCQENVNRYGTELFLAWHTNAEYNSDPCAANEVSWGSWGASQLISGDTLIGEVNQPNVQAWYDSIGTRNGVFANDSTYDQSIWVTYLYDYNLGAADTLTFYTVFATLHDSSLTEFEANLVDAKVWYLSNIRGSACATCCTGSTMGNVDCEGIVDIGDVTELIQLLFIRVGDPYCCEDEADLDYNEAIDIGDLSILINRLFITVTDPPPCP